MARVKIVVDDVERGGHECESRQVAEEVPELDNAVPQKTA